MRPAAARQRGGREFQVGPMRCMPTRARGGAGRQTAAPVRSSVTPGAQATRPGNAVDRPGGRGPQVGGGAAAEPQRRRSVGQLVGTKVKQRVVAGDIARPCKYAVHGAVEIRGRHEIADAIHRYLTQGLA